MRFERYEVLGRGSRGEYFSYRLCETEENEASNFPVRKKPRLRLLQITDIQLADPNSPNRFEFVNKLHDIAAARPFIPGHRPSELLTLHAAIAAVDRANSIHQEREVQVALITGDVIDSTQLNEAKAALAIIEGGEVDPRKLFGDYQGVQSDAIDDPFYYKPDAADDLMGELYGFPRIAGYLEATLRPQVSPGLSMPWLIANGNHEVLVQGMGASNERANQHAQGAKKPVALTTDGIDFAALAKRYEADATALAPLVTSIEINPLQRRRLLADGEFGALIRVAKGLPLGHGLSTYTLGEMNYFWYFEDGNFAVVALDTANRAGGARGSFTEECYLKLQEHLYAIKEHHPTALIIVISHHSLEEIDFEASQVTEEQIEAIMSSYKVLLWLSGHTHKDRVITNVSNKDRTFIEVTSASIADWPATIREVEIYDDVKEGTITVTLRSHMVSNGASFTGRGEIETGQMSELLGIHSSIIANTASLYGLNIEESRLDAITIECDRDRYL